MPEGKRSFLVKSFDSVSRDQIKRDWADSNGINLLRIVYTQAECIEDLLIAAAV
jgi:hypothetical protein